jgi:hypothetical protein
VDLARWRFADRMVEEHADVAQLVEQLIRNQQVNGSSPFVGSITFNNLAGSCRWATVQACTNNFYPEYASLSCATCGAVLI